jgi:hypothetical protein
MHFLRVDILEEKIYYVKLTFIMGLTDFFFIEIKYCAEVHRSISVTVLFGLFVW